MTAQGLNISSVRQGVGVSARAGRAYERVRASAADAMTVASRVAIVRTR